MRLDRPCFLQLVTALVAVCAMNWTAAAATFTFGSSANGLAARPGSTLLTSEEFQLQLAAGPSGAGLAETFSAGGLGVSSAAIPGVSGDEANVFGVLNSSDPELNGQGEFVRFSFDRPGVLTGLDFDGVKDELLEYFVLETAGREKVYFFDSSANMPDVAHPVYERPLDAAIDGGAVHGEVILLWEINGQYDDEVHDLSIPFAAGQEFRLTFGALSAPYAQGAPNGARLQRIIVSPIPEPGAAWLAVFGALAGWNSRRRYFDAKRAMS